MKRLIFERCAMRQTWLIAGLLALGLTLFSVAGSVYADEEGEGGTAKDTIDSICDTAGEGDIFWESGDTFGCQWGGQGGAGVTCTAVEGGATCCASSGPGDPNLSCWTENDWQIATPGHVKALEAKLKALREASKSTDPRVLAPRPIG